MNKYKLSMKTPSGLGTEYIYVESKYDNFERYLKEHNLKYQKQNFKTKQDEEIERLNNIINELEKELEEVFNKMKEKQVEINGRGYYYTDLIPIEDILGKLQELKGDSSNDK